MSSERADAGEVAGRREAATGGQGGYAMWVAWIEALRRGENRDTSGLSPIDGRMGSYVEARLLERLSTAFSERVRQWQTAWTVAARDRNKIANCRSIDRYHTPAAKLS